MSIIGSLFRKKKEEPESEPAAKKEEEAAREPAHFFHSDHYTRHNARRLEHLASLGLHLSGKTVLEFGAGIGDHSHYYIDRGCPITITEARPDNLAYLKGRYPGHEVLYLDLEKPEFNQDTRFQVVHCYGILYHLSNPAEVIDFMARLNSEILLLETCVSFGEAKAVNIVGENEKDPTQSFSGKGCRPTRPWVFGELKKYYEYVYIPLTQPNHEEFPIDWTKPEKFQDKLCRSIFIAARHPLDSPLLSAALVDQQTRHP
jgi:hypothetical protein